MKSIHHIHLSNTIRVFYTANDNVNNKVKKQHKKSQLDTVKQRLF